MGQCKSLFISRNILVPVSLFPLLHLPLHPTTQLLVCAVMAKINILVKTEITAFLKLFVYVKTVAYCAFIPHRVHIVEMVNVMNGSQMKLRCDLFHFFTALLLL